MHHSFSSKSAQSAFELKCRETLHTALHDTEMYLSWRDLDPGDSFDLDRRYASLPVLTKADIRAHFPYGLVPRGMDLDGALARGEVSFIKTSGTADEAITNIWNQGWWDSSEKASWSLNAVASRAADGAHREAILASALSVGPRSDGPPLSRETRTLGRFLFLNEFGSTELWPEGHERRLLADLADFKPAVLEANPSLLARLARFAARTGAAAFQPSLITLTYEFPSRLQLRAIRRVFGCPIASSYGSTEAGYVFMECERGSLHENSDFCRVDLIPVKGLGPEGSSTGRIVVTTFGNQWFPLLRFEIGDLGTLAPHPCPCGRRSGMTLSSIEGRLVSLCLAADGRLVTHGRIDAAVAGVDGVEEYRLDQEAPGSVRLRLIATGREEAAVLRDARDALHRLFGGGMDVSVEAIPRMVPEPSGKFLLVKRHFPLADGMLLPTSGGAHGG
jgi:phenylacetate-coenzyme A ligase PaaK-like adenylate-forming protein